MIRRTPGTFRSSGPFSANFLDLIYINSAPVRKFAQYTAGATLLDALAPIFPPTVEKCELLSFSVTAKLVLFLSEGNQPEDNSYGKLGRVITGLTQVGAPTSGASGGTQVTWTQKAQSLPNDLTLIADLWNPASDPMPPTIDTGNSSTTIGLQVGITHTLPTPIPIFQGTNILIGMWALPSILRCAVLQDTPVTYLGCFQASYSLVYEDGQ